MKHTNELEAGCEDRRAAGAVHRPTHVGDELGGHGGRGHAHPGRGGLGHGLDRPDRERGGGRARRGETRYVLLDALSGGPRHGYEIVKALEERSGGRYVPSPGTVYPTMQTFQDEGYVTAVQDGDRRVYQLTDAGRAELEAHAAEVEGFWARFQARGVARASESEVAFLEEDLESLKRTIWGGLGEAMERGDQQLIRRVRQAVEGCRNDVRNVIQEDRARQEPV